MNEVWKPVPSYEGLYEVSNLGNFRAVDRYVPSRWGHDRLYHGKPMLTETTYDNYQRIVLMKNGVKRRFMAHRLVALAFIPNPQNKPEVNHIDGNKSNNIVSNLEWCTASENTQHAFRTGLCKASKLKCTSKKTLCIETGKIWVSQNDAARELKVNSSTMAACIRRHGTCKGRHYVNI